MTTMKPNRPRVQRRVMEADLGFSWGVVNTVLLALGAGVLGAGYVTLSKGSVTLAPVLLVLGYCGLVPASLLFRGRKGGSGE
jgi:hypothetical protein